MLSVVWSSTHYCLFPQGKRECATMARIDNRYSGRLEKVSAFEMGQSSLNITLLSDHSLQGVCSQIRTLVRSLNKIGC